MYDVIIIGSGPSGLTAAIYTTRANLKTLVIAGSRWGGQLMLTSLVENFPGFPEGIMGPDLMMAMRKQAIHHGAEIIENDFTQGDFSKEGQFKITAGSKTYEGKCVIIATGADTKWLNVPGEKEKIGRGVSSCAPCDAAFFREKKVIVVGGGDSAMEEALILSRFAKKVIVVYRKNALRACKAMQEKAMENPKITFIFNTEIIEIMGEMKVEKVRLKSKVKSQKSKLQVKSQKLDEEKNPEELGGKTLEIKDQQLIWEMPIDGIFVAIGHSPNSKVFPSIETNEEGFIKVFNHAKTNIDGVFVAGDVQDSKYQQAITAAGFGCMAALEAERWLDERSA
ncbi:FAD-binding protein [Candidatus Microgenomates bacterium]|nr:MAG: FAD-binding protein [Candidatus Microgenomates bacterium]